MKKIVLIGDSIRMGYDKYIKEALANTATVYYPSENCRFAEYVLRYAHTWKKDGEWPDDVDLVHWNAGLWDVIELFDDEPLSTLAHYQNMIPRIDKRLRMLFPNAKLVFATSTAIVEHRCSKEFKRHNSIIKQYNDAAVEALKDTDTVINDLFAVTVNCPEDYHNDSVHYRTDDGLKLVGGKVLSVISKTLDISPKDINIDDFKPENYDEKSIAY